jgi:hypothetical protein
MDFSTTILESNEWSLLLPMAYVVRLMFVSFVANLFIRIVVCHLLPDQFFVHLMISCSPYPHTSQFGMECGSSREMWGLDSYYLSMMISCWETTLPTRITLWEGMCVCLPAKCKDWIHTTVAQGQLPTHVSGIINFGDSMQNIPE